MMADIEVTRRELGEIATNVYFLINKETKETVIVDPASSVNYLVNQLTIREYKPVAIFLTHGHFDHMYVADELRARLNVPIYACAEEKALLRDADKNRSRAWAEPRTLDADIYVSDGTVLELLGTKIKLMHTPGHTQGSCCYYFAEERFLISGDTLFFESYGRTDLDTGSQSAIRRSILEKLFVLPPSVKVYPGHGEATDIGHEQKVNPILWD